MHLLHSIAGIPRKWFVVSFILGSGSLGDALGGSIITLPSQSGTDYHTNGSPVLPMSLTASH